MPKPSDKKMKRNTKTTKTKTSVAGALKVWEDDPGTGVEVSLDSRPDPSAKPLAFRFPAPAPEPSDDNTSFAFRYWSAAAALRRGANFWAPRVPSGEWELGPMLPVLLDNGEDLNAFYDRQALNFFHGSSPDGVVFSGASPDIVCHEMGHAILDSVKPQLFDAGSQEAAAFHESFGDMSAILSDLQLPSLRAAISRIPVGTFPAIRGCRDSPSNLALRSVLRPRTLSIRIAFEMPPIPSAMRIQARCRLSHPLHGYRLKRILFHASSPVLFWTLWAPCSQLMRLTQQGRPLTNWPR
jgi:hypothetical protein